MIFSKDQGSKTRRRKLWGNFPALVTLGWTLLVLILWFVNFNFFLIDHTTLHQWEWRSYNFRFQTRGDLTPDPRIVLVGIDESSIFRDGLDPEDIAQNPGYAYLGDFPYSRKAYALAIEKLIQAGARLVVFDLLFGSEFPRGDTAESRADNLAFKTVLEKYSQQVVIGANFSIVDRGSEKPNVVEIPQLMLPHPHLLPSNEKLAEGLVGFVNYMTDLDGVIRRMNPVGWPVIQKEGGATKGIRETFFQQIPYSIDALAVKKAFPHIPLPHPFEEKFIRYDGHEVYPPIPFHLLFHTKSWESDRPPLLGGKLFKDKIVLIGPRANFMHDDHRTPFANRIYGVDIHANAISTLLNQRNLRETSDTVSKALILGIGILFSWLMTITRSPLGKLIPGTIVGLAYYGVAQYYFYPIEIFIPLIPVELIIIGSTCTVVTWQAISESLERRRLSTMLHRYVSKNVADELIEKGEDITIPKKRFITILFSDVRDFTTMTEKSDPAPLMKQLNEYLTEMVDCVFQNHGTLDKFIGDAVMAVYGSPTSQGTKEDAWNAVLTALQWREKLAELNMRWEKEGRLTFRIGVGINAGEAMTGEFGSKQKVEYGAIGDAVNVASRVEGLNKGQGTDILITEIVYELVQDKVEVELKGDIPVKGRGQPVKVYALKSVKK